MGTDYVNVNVSVKCPALIGKFTVRELVNKKVKVDGKIALTQSGAKLTGSGTCKILTAAASGVPQPCQCKMSCTLLVWQNVSNNTAQGSPLLLQTSVNQCSVGRAITIASAGQNKAIKDMSVSVPSLESLAAVIIDEQVDNGMYDNIEPPPTNLPGTNTESMTNATSAAGSTTTAMITEKEKSAAGREFLCLGEYFKDAPNCSERIDEEKMREIATKNAEEDAMTEEELTAKRNKARAKIEDNYLVTLREKYPSQYNKRDKMFQNDLTAHAESPIEWGYQAHHIISHHVVYAKSDKLCKKNIATSARKCGYDINSGKNCIMLL